MTRLRTLNKRRKRMYTSRWAGYSIWQFGLLADAKYKVVTTPTLNGYATVDGQPNFTTRSE